MQRLVASGAAYQTASVVSAGLGALLLPVYTRALTPADYGLAETLLTYLILASIPLRLGLGRRSCASGSTTTTRSAAAASRGWRPARCSSRRRSRRCWRSRSPAPLSELLLDERDATLFGFGVLGLWAFTNLEIAYALLRVEERRRDVPRRLADQRRR